MAFESGMVKYHIWNERLSFRHCQLYLSPDVCEALPKFEQETSDIAGKFIFQLLLGCNLFVDETEIIRTFQNGLCQPAVRRREFLFKVIDGVTLLTIKVIINFCSELRTTPPVLNGFLYIEKGLGYGLTM